jgi:hypothetical protein
MMLMGKMKNVVKNCLSVILFTTDSQWTGMGLNRALYFSSHVFLQFLITYKFCF